jgi:hypothetical protein
MTVRSSSSALCCALLLYASPTQAYLGGFEDLDGYTNDYNLPTGPFGSGASSYNVTRYNAGQYGTNGGGTGGSPSLITANTGLWQQIDTAVLFGNRYALAHLEVGAAHAYDGTSMLGLRNDIGVADALIMRYFVDDRDRGGLSYNATLGASLNWSIRVCPDAVGSGSPTTPVFHWTFRDANLDAGFQVGWNTANTIIYKSASSSTWTTTSYVLDNVNYDRIDISLNAAAGTWSLNVWDESLSLSQTLVNNATMDSSMEQLGYIDWTLAAGQQKHFFDNSVLTVPEPSSALLTGLATLLHLRRRRSSSTHT